MDLTNFSNRKNENKKKELIFEDALIKIEKHNDKKIFFLKDALAFEKYENELFLSLTKSKILNNALDTKNFLKKSQDDFVEGIMLKKLESTYRAGARVGNMYKLKDSKEDLDLVIVGAEMGTGKRAGFFSSFLIACLDRESLEEEDKFLIIGKVSSGIKELGDEGISMSNLTTLLATLKIKEDKKNQIIYFEPKVIVQVAYQDLQKSEIYKSGLALRFPRLKCLREDKNLEEVTSIQEIENFK